MVSFTNISEEKKFLHAHFKSTFEKVLHTGQFTSAFEVEQFEKEFASYLGCQHVVAVHSGTAALHVSFVALKLCPGDQVIIPSFTFAAVAEAVFYCGATPVFVDVTEDTWTLDPEQVKQAVCEKTVGVVPVHLFGQVADIGSLMQIARKENFWIVEDACQAHGAEDMGKYVGTFGEMGVFSFYPTKNLGGIGEGGAIATSRTELANLAKKLRNHGSSLKYCHEILGFNYRLNEIQAAALRVQLPFLTEWNVRRRELADTYTKALSGLPIQLPSVKTESVPVYHQYTILTKHRDQLRSFLVEKEIETEIFYPVPLHKQPAFKHSGKIFGDLTVTHRLAREALSLPLHPGLKEEEIEYVVNNVTQFFRRS